MNGKGYHFGRDPVTVGSDVGNLHEGYDDGLVVLGSIASPVLLSLSLSYIYLYSTYYKNSHGIHRFLSSIYAVII